MYTLFEREKEIMELGEFFQEVALDCGVLLLEYHAAGKGRSPNVRVIVDTERGITIGEIEQVTRRIRDSSEMDRYFPSGFRLEVTSPGLDFPLVREYQFRRNINRPIRVFHKNPDFPNPVEGVLKKVTEDQIGIESANDNYELAFPLVLEGKLILQ